MQPNEELLTGVLSQRLGNAEPHALRFFDGASEVVIFGSMSAGLQRPDSDIDVLCIGGRDLKLKTRLLDLIVVPLEATKSRAWLESELATHVGAYGTWIKGTPLWKNDARVGPSAVDAKFRRVSAFMRALHHSWFRLEECFRSKYAVKLRRETQRLILLERNVAIPPTRILDHSWSTIAQSPRDVCARLFQFSSDADRRFINDLVDRVDAHFQDDCVQNHTASTAAHAAGVS
jgi:predicted nucleotidyltransferase